MTVRFANAEPNGLAELVGRLIETNLEAEPDRRALLRDTVVRLKASDAAMEATVTLSSAMSRRSWSRTGARCWARSATR